MRFFKIKALLACLLCVSVTGTAFSQVPNSLLRDRDALMAAMMLNYTGGSPLLSSVTPTVNELMEACLLRGQYNRSAINNVQSQVQNLMDSKSFSSEQDVKFASEILVRLWEANFSQCRFR